MSPVTRNPQWEEADQHPAPESEPVSGQAIYEKARQQFIPAEMRKRELYEAFTASQMAQTEPAPETPEDEESWIERTATSLAAGSDSHIERVEAALELAREKRYLAEFDAYEAEESDEEVE
jgi:hypothetical protein